MWAALIILALGYGILRASSSQKVNLPPVLPSLSESNSNMIDDFVDQYTRYRGRAFGYYEPEAKKRFAELRAYVQRTYAKAKQGDVLSQQIINRLAEKGINVDDPLAPAA
jgi:hypothetical protein